VDPLTAGYLQFIDDGSGNTLLQVDIDGPDGPAGWETVLKLAGLSSGSIATQNYTYSFFSQFPVTTTAAGTSFANHSGNDTYVGTGGNDTFADNHGDNAFNGMGGNDLFLNV